MNEVLKIIILIIASYLFISISILIFRIFKRIVKGEQCKKCGYSWESRIEEPKDLEGKKVKLLGYDTGRETHLLVIAIIILSIVIYVGSLLLIYFGK